MLRSYIYNTEQDNWLEESNLLYHDICALLDEDERIIYLWKGPQSTQDRFKKSYRSAGKLLSNYPEGLLELKVLEDEVPESIQAKIDEMLEMMRKTEQKKTLIFSRYHTIKAYYYLSLIQSILPIILLINFIGFSVLPQDGTGNIVLEATLYQFWILFASTLAFLIGIIFLLMVGLAAFERDLQSGIFALAGLVASIGLYTYVQQGIFLFIFQPGSTSELYYISLFDLWIFIIIMVGVIVLIEVPTIYKFLKFKKDYSEFLL